MSEQQQRAQQNDLQQTLHNAFERSMYAAPTEQAKWEATCAWLGALVSEYVLIAAIVTERTGHDFMGLVLEDLHVTFGRHFPEFAGGHTSQHAMLVSHVSRSPRSESR